MKPATSADDAPCPSLCITSRASQHKARSVLHARPVSGADSAKLWPSSEHMLCSVWRFVRLCNNSATVKTSRFGRKCLLSRFRSQNHQWPSATRSHMESQVWQSRATSLVALNGWIVVEGWGSKLAFVTLCRTGSAIFSARVAVSKRVSLSRAGS